MISDDIDPDLYYIVEQRASGMSILPFGFKTDDAASAAMKGFVPRRRKMMRVVVGAKLGEIKGDYVTFKIK